MKKFVVAVVIILVVAAFGLVLKGTFRPKLRVPFFAESPTGKLANELGKAGVLTSGPPILIGETITASISGVKVLFSGRNDIFTQVRALQFVLLRIKMVDKIPKEIDLRFNKVVIRY